MSKNKGKDTKPEGTETDKEAKDILQDKGKDDRGSGR